MSGHAHEPSDDLDGQLRQRSVGAPAARSALLTLLGEYVLHLERAVWQETLIAALGAMGYKNQASRQALARSVTAGWLTRERQGRRTRVRLTSEAATMLRTGADRIYGFGQPAAWDGRWLLVVLRVPELRREVRHQFRTRLAWAGFGSLGGGLWLSPHAEREAELAAMAANGSVADVLSFTAEVGQLGGLDRIVSDAWDLAAVESAYRQFIGRFDRLRPTTPEAVFRAQTQIVHEWRKFPFLDPDLPQSALPEGWPREHAHDVFHGRHAAWHGTAQRYFESLDSVSR